MTGWNTRTRQWLRHEGADQDDAAEAELTALFAALPEIEPSPGFVDRTARLAWLARGRARRRWLWVAASAAVVVAASIATMASSLVGIAAGWVLVPTASGLASGCVALLKAAATVLEWWSVAARAGGTMAGIAALPEGAAVLAGIELAGAATLFVLYRLLRGGLTVRHPRSFCF